MKEKEDDARSGGHPAGDEHPPDNERVKSGERIPEPKPFRKVLLANDGLVWMFKVEEGRRTYYTVESEDRCWKFGFLFSAEGKFSREVKRRYGGNL